MGLRRARRRRRKRTPRTGSSERTKGLANEAVGDLARNWDRKAEGQADQAIGGVEEKVDAAIDRMKGAIHPE